MIDKGSKVGSGPTEKKINKLKERHKHQYDFYSIQYYLIAYTFH